MKSYDIGDIVTLPVAITVDGSAADPTTLTLTVQDPLGEATAYVYGTDAEITRSALGSFVGSISPDSAGTWSYQWVGTGAAKFADEGAFYVRSRPAFCDVGDLAAFLQLTIAADSESAQAAIRGATAAIRNYCHQQISIVEDEEITVDVGEYRTKLYLPELPVIEVSEVIEDDVELDDGDDYKLGSHGILHRMGGRYWYSGIQTVEITYTHGYVTIPEIVRDIATRAAARAYQAGLRAAVLVGIPGVQGQTVGDYSVTFGSEQAGGVGSGGTLGASAAPILLPSEKAVLAEYRYRSA